MAHSVPGEAIGRKQGAKAALPAGSSKVVKKYQRSKWKIGVVSTAEPRQSVFSSFQWNGNCVARHNSADPFSQDSGIMKTSPA